MIPTSASETDDRLAAYLGHGALAALYTLMQFANGEDAGLGFLAARERWQSVFLWMGKGTEAIKTLTREDLLDAAGWRRAELHGTRRVAENEQRR